MCVFIFIGGHMIYVYEVVIGHVVYNVGCKI